MPQYPAHEVMLVGRKIRVLSIDVGLRNLALWYGDVHVDPSAPGQNGPEAQRVRRPACAKQRLPGASWTWLVLRENSGPTSESATLPNAVT